MSFKDQFWWENPRILWDEKRRLEFWPSARQSFEERVNATTRFLMIAGVLISALKMDPLFFFIGSLCSFVLALFTRVAYSRKTDGTRFPRHWFPEETLYAEDECDEPTTDNPFQNTLSHHYDNPDDKLPACVANENKDLLKDMYYKDLPTDFTDPYKRSNGYRQFYSMPSTTIPNDQPGFAQWLYGDMHSIKEKNVKW